MDSSNVGSPAKVLQAASIEGCRQFCIDDPACETIEYDPVYDKGRCEIHYTAADLSKAGSYRCEVLTRGAPRGRGEGGVSSNVNKVIRNEKNFESASTVARVR